MISSAQSRFTIFKFPGEKSMYRNTFAFRFFAFALALIALVALGGGAAYGQAISGNLVGTVSDSSGAVVTNARVEVTNLGTGVTAAATTSATGGYRFDNLPIGTYKITVRASGFRTFSQQAEVELNKTG